ncbi:MAG TPA: general stress protein, partial [Roseiflexaceae bacterium]|nr:general stress protein [Roseiflexaceae bacterium]
MRTIAGLFDRREDAERAVRELVDAGIDRAEISMIAHDTTTGEAREVGGSEAGAGAGAGAVAGATAGGLLGLLVGIGALAIPGIGPVIAAGPLAAAIGSAAAGTLVGAAGGAVAGGLIGALVGAGIPAEEAEFYAEGIRRGGTLVTVNAPDAMVETAARIMQSCNAVDVDERSLEWRRTGWTGFER